MDFKEKYASWLFNPCIDDKTKGELKGIEDNEGEIEDRFYRDLEFGTGGLRGVIAAGTNRMNIYMVRKASQGLANYIKKLGENAMLRGVAIAYDCRHKSREFAMESAGIFAGNGIKAYVFEDLRPTPELSYAVRKLSAIAGIVVTASHNPPEYNGYKVYWEDGGQVSLDIANGILDEINNVPDVSHVIYKNLDTAKNEGLFSVIGEEIDNMYIDDVQTLLINKELIEKQGSDFKIIYTPLHGTGNIPVRKSLKKAGFKNVYIVKEQELPDPNFSTVKSPNPEEHSAFELALKLSNEVQPDAILGTDPDCDRLGICVKNPEGKYITLTGNQVGALLIDYILSQLKEKNKLPENGVVVKTIVTSELGRVIASSYGIETIDTLTGFKYIGDKIKEFESKASHSFLFGYEESYGYLSGTFVRDKDAVIASTLVCDMGCYYKSKGITIYEALQSIYDRFGYYMEDLKSITLKGKEGLETIGKIMKVLRENTPESIGDERIVEVKDYINGLGDLPAADVLQLLTDKKSLISIRPSGTEPKIKVYYSANGKTKEDVEQKLSSLKDNFASVVEGIIKS
jgi:Phosphomannomutase